MTQVLTRLKSSSTWKNLYDIDNVALTHYIDKITLPVLNYIMLRDIDYVVSPLSKEIPLLLTSLLSPYHGRSSFSDGAPPKPLRAKEGVPVKKPRLLPQSLTKICSVCTRNCQV